MSDRDRTSTPERTRARGLMVLGPVALWALVGAIFRLFGRRKSPLAEVDRAVREVREEMGRGRGPDRGLPQPTPEQVRERREERRRREAEEARR